MIQLDNEFPFAVGFFIRPPGKNDFHLATPDQWRFTLVQEGTDKPIFPQKQRAQNKDVSGYQTRITPGSETLFFLTLGQKVVLEKTGPRRFSLTVHVEEKTGLAYVFFNESRGKAALLSPVKNKSETWNEKEIPWGRIRLRARFLLADSTDDVWPQKPIEPDWTLPAKSSQSQEIVLSLPR